MSDFSVFVPISEAQPGQQVIVGVVVVENDCGGLEVNGFSDSVHVNNYMTIGDAFLYGTELGESNSWVVDLPPGSYTVVYHIGERGLGEQPVGASFDFNIREVECPVPSTSSTSSSSTSSTTVTTVPSTTTSSTPDSTTTTGVTVPTSSTVPPETTTSSIVTTTSVPPGSTLPDTGFDGAAAGVGMFLVSVGALILMMAKAWKDS